MKRKPASPAPETQPPGALIGYARVSTVEQSLDLQTEALRNVGCLNIYEEKKSGASNKRPQLDLAIMDLRPGDTLVVWRLDRLARSGRELYTRLAAIEAAGAGFKSLQEQFDFSTTTGKFVLGILGLVAELERNMTIERTRAGMATRMRQGKQMGRTRLMTEAMKKRARTMMLDGVELKAIAAKLGVATSTVGLNFPGGKRAVIAAELKKRSKR